MIRSWRVLNRIVNYIRHNRNNISVAEGFKDELALKEHCDRVDQSSWFSFT